jgi:hypothetical protein
MPGSSRSVLLAAAVLLLADAGCQQPKEAPVISAIDGSRSVRARDSAGYTCNASDPNLEPLSYSWSQEGGRLGWDWGKTVRWLAPESSGQSIIRVTVTNEDGLSASDSLRVTVRAETAGVLFWDGAVKAGDFQAWSDTVRPGYETYGYCGSDSGKLFLMVMDDSSFTNWVAGQPPVWLLRETASDKGNAFSVRIGALGLYHIIMDNKEGTADYNYYLYVWKAGP